jgi:hypothetical protein
MAQIEKKIEFEEEYELVTVHTTFDLSSSQLRYISMIDGVSSLQEFTRYNVQSIADGGALYHQSLIEKQMLKICKQIN